MKLSEYKGEKAIEVFADLLEPTAEILADEDIVNAIRADESKIAIIKKILKGHSKAIVEIMAILDDENPDEYEVDFMTLPKKLLDLFNDPMVIDLFTSQGQDAE